MIDVRIHGGLMSKISFAKTQSKDRIISILFGALALIILIVSGFFVLEEHGLIPFLVIFVATISALVLWHSRSRGYQCSNCGHEFEISFWQDLPTINSIFFMKKMLRCPACKFKDYATELTILRAD